VLVTIGPLACVAAASIGLMFGTLFNPRSVTMLFGVVIIPITFLGCVYFQWQALEAIRWLQIAVLINPLVYMCEGFRAALTPVPHMSLWAIYPVMIGFSALFTWMGITNFNKRVLS
jgi:ABC-2 type transport system permease protein